MLICGGLAQGKSVIHGIAPSQDVLATLDCLAALGAAYCYEGDTVTIDGIGIPSDVYGGLHCRESGSTLRFFLPLCMFSDQKKSLFGSQTLLSRPLDVYAAIAQRDGILFTNDGREITVSGRLKGGEYTLPGNISSQFITGLLFALPLLDSDSIIKIIPPVESLSYINMTISTLSVFGIEIIQSDKYTLQIKGNQRFSPREVKVEGDYSNAAFFAALGHLGAPVSVAGLNEDSLQGDKVYEELFRQLDSGTPEIDISDCPDLGPVLFAVAAAKNGAVFTGTKRLKIKESDRCQSMAEELRKFGTDVRIEENSVTITPTSFTKPKEALYGHNDHRIVMSLSILLTLTGGSIDGAEAVNKSMPDFFEKLQQAGADINHKPL